jgi:hypothetical protein
MSTVKVNLAIAMYNGVFTTPAQLCRGGADDSVRVGVPAIELFTASDQSIPFVYFQF